MAEAMDTTPVVKETLLTFENANDLKALDLFSAKNDVRYWLNGIHIDRNHVTATNGHVLLRIRHGQNLDLGPDGIVLALPKFTVKASNPGCAISIKDIETPTPHGTGYVVSFSQTATLLINAEHHDLQILDGQKGMSCHYPDVTKVIPDFVIKEERSFHAPFNAKYLELIGKTAKLLNPKNKNKNLACWIYGGNPKNAHRVEIQNRDDIHLVIMPMRY